MCTLPLVLALFLSVVTSVHGEEVGAEGTPGGFGGFGAPGASGVSGGSGTPGGFTEPGLSGYGLDPDPSSEPGSGGGNFGDTFSDRRSGSATFCPVLSSQLAHGMSDATVGGGQVSALQQFLGARYGITALSGGYFGHLTKQYVMQFQQEHGLSAIGEVGPQTRAKIAEVCSRGQQGSAVGAPVAGVGAVLRAAMSALAQAMERGDSVEISVALGQVTTALGLSQVAGTQTQTTSTIIPASTQTQTQTQTTSTITPTSTQTPTTSTITPTSTQTPTTSTITPTSTQTPTQTTSIPTQQENNTPWYEYQDTPAGEGGAMAPKSSLSQMASILEGLRTLLQIIGR